MKKIFPRFVFLSFFFYACTVSNKTALQTLPATLSTQRAETPTTNVATPFLTETPTTPSLDATKHPSEWDLSAFTKEQQAWINQTMTDPDHASPEAKQFYSEMRVEGIREQTGDASYTVEDATGAQLGKYTEWLFAQGIRETAPLPFGWRKANLENPDNLVGFNYNAKRGYTIEGYDGFGILADETKTSGYGENDQPFPSHDTLLLAKDYRLAKGNAQRDTIFGEPSMVILPRGSYLRGDLMTLTDIAGVNSDIAQEAIIRLYDESGTARYTLVRLQYQDEKVQQGDTSCETIPGAQSIICAPGTTISHTIMSTWSDWQLYTRKNAVNASEGNMVVLFGLFRHPPMITIADTLHGDEQFIDGAIAAQDIRIPAVPDGFLK